MSCVKRREIIKAAVCAPVALNPIVSVACAQLPLAILLTPLQHVYVSHALAQGKSVGTIIDSFAKRFGQRIDEVTVLLQDREFLPDSEKKHFDRARAIAIARLREM